MAEPEPNPPQHVEPELPIPVHYLYELAWFLPSIAIPVALLVVILLTAYGLHVQVPGDAGRVCSTQLNQVPTFARPGVFQTGPGRYEAHVVAQTWSFDPPEIRVPVDSTVTFLATSRDVIHGFMIHDVNVNVMLLPGQVARVSAHFEKPGDYPILCHEYCGVGHHTMWGHVRVERAP
jgi:cytochrome c oxidase subunit 2